MRYLSVCSGIEAASVAWHDLGWTPLAFSEIEPFPRAVLAHHFPGVPLHGDFTVLRDQSWIVDADLLVGGTPCQAFSVAGLRGSLTDARGNLTLEFVRLADAIDDLRRAAGRAPAWIVWENVPGVLSVSDNAFGAFLGGLVGSDAAIEPPRGRGWTDAGVVRGPRRCAAWRVLDAQHFGVAQRRRRVFVLARGGAGDWAAADALLPVIESVRWHPAPRREAREGSAAGAARGTRGGGGLGTDAERDGALIASTGPVSHCLNAGGMGRQDYETETLIAHTLRGEGFDASEDGTGRGTPLVPVAFAQNSRDEVRLQNGDGQIVGALAAESGMKQTTYVAFAQNQLGEVRTGEVLNTLNTNSNASGRNTPMVAVPVGITLHGTDGTQSVASFTELSSSLRARTPSGVENSTTTAVLQAVPVAWSIMPQNSGRDYKARSVDVLQPLMAMGPQPSTNQGGDIIQQAMQVRRLTPRECERLQGFPDDWTLIPWRGRPAPECPDGPRYKALGNSMAVPCMRWIGERIAEVSS